MYVCQALSPSIIITISQQFYVQVTKPLIASTIGFTELVKILFDAEADTAA